MASCFTKLREDNVEKEGRFGKAGANKIRIVRLIPPVNPEIICVGRRQNSIGPFALKNKNRVSRRNRRFCVVEKRICSLSESTAGGRTEASLCITQLNITSPYLSSKIAINITFEISCRIISVIIRPLDCLFLILRLKDGIDMALVSALCMAMVVSVTPVRFFSKDCCSSIDASALG